MTKDKSVLSEFFTTSRRIRQTARSGGYILIIEDDVAIAMLCSKIIKSCGVDFRWVDTVSEATLLIKNEHENIQCVLADLTLPDGNGMEIVNLIENEFSTIPYVIHTANTDCVEDIHKQYPRAEVIFKHRGISALLHALNLEEKSIVA